MKIGIVGLGLIGGSIAKRFRDCTKSLIIEACDTDPQSLEQARTSGVIDKAVSEIRELSQDLDIVFVCTPISVTVEHLNAVVNHVSDTTIVTDVASVKATIAKQISRSNVVPGHPIAGTQFSGFSASDSSIMEGATYVLIPSELNHKSLSKLSMILSECGFNVETMTAEAHDTSLAATSHIPYLVAVALRDHAEQSGVSDSLKGTGYKSATRVAAMPASWGEDILRENAVAIKSQLADIIDRLNQYR